MVDIALVESFVAVLATLIISLPIIRNHYLSKVENIIEEAVEYIEDVENCLVSVDKAIKDGKVTKDEVGDIIKNCKSLISKVKNKLSKILR